ncbi:hypothetical protein T484DRAFT_1839137 [Baffinella frigidus]|nr:hypothetical protein T484DRAFT_1839137 [Cryptophyta sp. CCMP2293]
MQAMQGRGHEKQLSVDLVRQAADHRRFLAAVHLSPLSLYTRSPDLERAIHEYTDNFLPLLAGWTESSPPPPPPLEVAWVWQLHKLDPTAYARDCVKAFGRVVGVHPRQPPFSFSPAPTNDVAPVARSAEDQGQATPFSISTDIAASAERQAGFLWQVRWAQYSREEWLRDAEQRYRMMLHLMGQDHARFIVPTYDIDLMWHTHMAYPGEYREDTLRLAGRVVGHDDSVNDRAEGSKLTTCAANTRNAWMDLYGTPWARPGGMWQGDPPSWYFENRDVAADLLGSVLAIGARAAASAEQEVLSSQQVLRSQRRAASDAASALAAGVPRTIRMGASPALVAPTLLVSMTVSGRSMGAPTTTAITIPGWGHFAPVPPFTSRADRPEPVEATLSTDKVRPV